LKVGFVSLGCPKNLVDTEVMMGQLNARGHALTASPEDADAMAAMGLDRTRFLVTPKVVALLVMLPLLTLYADLVGIIGVLGVWASGDLGCPGLARGLNFTKPTRGRGLLGRGGGAPLPAASISFIQTR
jgi:hypothetical protein